MLKRVVCNKCNSVLEYDDKSVCEGNRDFEEVNCPKCRNVVARVFTDLCPRIRLADHNKDMQ